MANSATVDALHLDTLVEGTLFFAAARDVAHFCSRQHHPHRLSLTHTNKRQVLTTTVGTFRDLTIIRETGVLKTSQVLLDRRGPALAESGSLRLVAEVEADHVLAVELALKVDQAHAVANRFLLYHVSVHIFRGLVCGLRTIAMR